MVCSTQLGSMRPAELCNREARLRSTRCKISACSFVSAQDDGQWLSCESCAQRAAHVQDRLMAKEPGPESARTCTAQQLDGEGRHEEAGAELARRRDRVGVGRGAGAGRQPGHHGDAELEEEQLEATAVQLDRGPAPVCSMTRMSVSLQPGTSPVY